MGTQGITEADILAGRSLWCIGMSEADSDALAGPGVTNRISHMLREAFAQGVGGVAADILSYASDDWGFELDKVTAPVLHTHRLGITGGQPVTRAELNGEKITAAGRVGPVPRVAGKMPEAQPGPVSASTAPS